MSRRMTLRRADGRIYLDRWGLECRWAGVFIHKMSAPDPGIDLHDHPWTFASLILAGGYTEERVETRQAPALALAADEFSKRHPDGVHQRGFRRERRRWSLRVMRLDECHRITDLDGPTCWTLVIHGPKRRHWGFYLPYGWMEWRTYERTVRAQRRDLHYEGPDPSRVTR
jgi:hypothetical protein